MKEETPQELLDRMAPLFGLEKKRVGKNSFRWAEKSASTKRRPTKRAADVCQSCGAIDQFTFINIKDSVQACLVCGTHR